MEADKTITQEQREATGRTQLPSREVIVTNVKMPFGSMVAFIIKWTIASIPAIIILSILLAVIFAVLGGLFGGLVGEF